MIECPQCHSPVSKEFINDPDFHPCPACHQEIQAFVFPALFAKPETPPITEPLVVSDEATCFYHPDKKAIIPCSSCGRFLCSLCDIEFDQQHLCPACLQSGAKKKKIRNMDAEAVCYDKIVFAVAAYTIFIFPLTIVTAPMAVFLCIRYWRTTSISGSRARMVVALLIALAEIIFWVLVFTAASRHHHG